jgi:feruloyl-CoA synthase
VPLEGKLDARVKGPNITPGYWNAPELTAAAFDEEGYYRFGDALRFADPDDISAGFLFDGRTAENFKLDTGTWVSTGALRTRLIDHFGGLVRDAAIAGADRPFIGALAFPDLDALRKLSGLDADAAPERIFMHQAVRDALQARLESLARQNTGSSTLVRRLILVDPPASLDSGEMTDKGSISQRAVLRNRAGLVEELYSDSPRVIEIGR